MTVSRLVLKREIWVPQVFGRVLEAFLGVLTVDEATGLPWFDPEENKIER